MTRAHGAGRRRRWRPEDRASREGYATVVSPPNSERELVRWGRGCACARGAVAGMGAGSHMRLRDASLGHRAGVLVLDPALFRRQCCCSERARMARGQCPKRGWTEQFHRCRRARRPREGRAGDEREGYVSQSNTLSLTAAPGGLPLENTSRLQQSKQIREGAPTKHPFEPLGVAGVHASARIDFGDVKTVKNHLHIWTMSYACEPVCR